MTKNFTLEQLLRYGLAGTAFVTAALCAFSEPRAAVATLDGALAAAYLGAFSLMVGSVIYGFHRALPYPLIRFAMLRILGRKESPIDVDIARWRHARKRDSALRRFGEWAGQIHFLYCVSWAGFAALLLGRLVRWHASRVTVVVVYVTTAILIAALAYHFSMQLYEKRIMADH